MRPHVAKERRWRNVSLPELLRSRDLPCSGVDNHTASSAKENEIKTSENPFISFHLFFRIETFQIITSEKAKKSGSLSTRVRGCERERFERLCDHNSFPPGARPLGSTHTAAKKVRNINF
jgi:hypothetical protein